MNEVLKRAVREANRILEEETPGKYYLVGASEYPKFFIFGCKKRRGDTESVFNGPVIDKKTLEQISMDTAERVLLPEPMNTYDLTEDA